MQVHIHLAGALARLRTYELLTAVRKSAGKR